MGPQLWDSQRRSSRIYGISRQTRIAEDVTNSRLLRKYRTSEQLCMRTWTRSTDGMFLGFCGSDHREPCSHLRWSALAPTGSVKHSLVFTCILCAFSWWECASHVLYILFAFAAVSSSNYALREQVEIKGSVSTSLLFICDCNTYWRTFVALCTRDIV